MNIERALTSQITGSKRVLIAELPAGQNMKLIKNPSQNDL
jgi:hypothetical protein